MADLHSPYGVASAVLAEVQDALETAGRPVTITQVAVGAFVVDDCCAGNLAVAVERVFRTTMPWPTEASADEVCADTPIGIELCVRVDRCTPVAQDSGRPPEASAVEASHRGLLQDAAIVWNVLGGSAILGEDTAETSRWERANLHQEFVGAQGGCIAVETRVTYGVSSGSEWCEEVAP